MQARSERAGTATRLLLEGELMIEEAAQLRKILIASLEDNDSVVVDLGGVIHIDLSCLQLLCCAHRTASSSGKRFSISPGIPSPVEKEISDSGYMRKNGNACSSSLQNCLWVRETAECAQDPQH